MLALKLLVNNISYLGNLKKLIKNLTSYKSNSDNCRFALFLAVMNAVYKFFLCILRRLLKSDKLAAPIAGFLAGLASAIDLKSRRELFLVLLLSRLTDTAYSMAEDRGYARRIKYGEVLAWVFCNMTQQYAMGLENDIMNRGQMRFMIKWAQMAGNPMEMIKAWNASITDRVKARLTR